MSSRVTGRIPAAKKRGTDDQNDKRRIPGRACQIAHRLFGVRSRREAHHARLLKHCGFEASSLAQRKYLHTENGVIITWPRWWRRLFGPRCNFTIWNNCCGRDCVRYRGHPLPHRTEQQYLLFGYIWWESDGVPGDTLICDTDGLDMTSVRRRRPFPVRGV
jgi:hypothetical protein